MKCFKKIFAAGLLALCLSFGLRAQGLPSGVDGTDWRGGWFTGFGAGAASVYNGGLKGFSSASLRVFVGKALTPSLGGALALDVLPYALGASEGNVSFVHGSLLWEPFVTAGWGRKAVSVVGRAGAGCLLSLGKASPAAAAGLGVKVNAGPSSALILEASGTVCSEEKILGSGRVLAFPALTLSLLQFID